MSRRTLQSLALALVLAAAWGNGAAAQGDKLFAKHCQACHQPNGRGLPGVYPPLTGHIGKFLRVPEGRPYLVRAVAFGLWGVIVVERRPYRGFMPPQTKLSDGDITELLNYVLTELEPGPPADFSPYTAPEVADYRQKAAGPTEILNERHALLALLEKRAEAPDGIPVITGTAEDFSRNCQGCHRADGMGAPGAVPRLQRFVGYFTHLPEGREFLIRLPGIALAPIDDERLADVVNFTLRTFSPRELPADFRPYSAEEVGRLRKDLLVDIEATRERLVHELQTAGIITDNDDGLGPLPE